MATLRNTRSFIARNTLAWAVGGLVLTMGCASREPQQKMTPAAGRMSAEDQRAQARAHERMAEQAEEKQQGPEKKGALERDQLRREERMHREHAREHEQMAAELERFESDECRGVSSEQRASCPLMGPISHVTNVDGGVHLTFPTGTDTNQILAQMRCHAAFARAHGYQGMEACPLYHPGVSFSVGNDGHSIELTSTNPTIAAELQHEASLMYGSGQ